MRRDRSGTYTPISTVGQEAVQAFVPDPLPPSPPLKLAGRLRETLDHALLQLGRLDGIRLLLPDIRFFLYTYIRKEAVLSSQIEGTQSSLAQLLLFEIEEAPGVPLDDVAEVSRYVSALEHGVSRIRSGFPISGRLLREVHRTLLATGRGSSKIPGEFRRSQNWIGGTRPGNATFVPPPPDRVPECMAALEQFVHLQDSAIPIVAKAALVHAQFETVHPFLDGNGRVGRLLITLMLCAEGVLEEPLLYLSLYFKQNRQQYYHLLDSLRTTGDWEKWLLFFAEAVTTTARESVETARTLVDLFRDDRHQIQTTVRAAGSALQVHHQLQRRPLATIKRLAESTGLTIPTVTKALHNLENLHIVQEVTGRRRRRVYAYRRYLELLNEGTESIAT